MTIVPQKIADAGDNWGAMQNRFQSVGQNRKLTARAVRGLIGVAALILVLGGYWYFNHRPAEGEGGAARFSGAAVRVAKVVSRDMPVVERTIGTVISGQTIQVTSEVAGPVTAAYFKEGQMVKKGDLLFQINPLPFRAALNQARGQLAKDQAALAGARRDLKRFQALMAAGAESQQVLDDETATVATDEGIVQSDTANVDTAQINLDYTQIRSPVEGKTGPIMIQPGNVISVTGTTATSVPLVTINQIQPIKISFFLPQGDLPRILAREKSGGLNATIDQTDVGGTNFNVPVDFVSNSVNGLTGTIELRATYPNADSGLVPGQLVNVVVELSNIPHATIIPHDALTAGPEGQYVFRITDGRAEQVPIKVLFDDTKDVAVDSDLKAGDRVVVDGQLQVTPGGAVTVVKGLQATANDSQAGGEHKRGGHKPK
jgi:membrane fusion protein, multidrug efflux system